MKISDNTSISMPMRNLLAILAAVAMGILAYTEVTARLTSLETSRELFNADLLKKSEQLPTVNANAVAHYNSPATLADTTSGHIVKSVLIFYSLSNL